MEDSFGGNGFEFVAGLWREGGPRGIISLAIMVILAGWCRGISSTCFDSVAVVGFG